MEPYQAIIMFIVVGIIFGIFPAVMFYINHREWQKIYKDRNKDN